MKKYKNIILCVIIVLFWVLVVKNVNAFGVRKTNDYIQKGTKITEKKELLESIIKVTNEIEKNRDNFLMADMFSVTRTLNAYAYKSDVKIVAMNPQALTKTYNTIISKATIDLVVEANFNDLIKYLDMLDRGPRYFDVVSMKTINKGDGFINSKIKIVVLAMGDYE